MYHLTYNFCMCMCVYIVRTCWILETCEYLRQYFKLYHHGSVYLLSNITRFPTPSPWQPYSPLCFYEFSFIFFFLLLNVMLANRLAIYTLY